MCSLDGCAAAEGWPGWWGWWGLEGPDYLTWPAEGAATERTLLMGAKTYRLVHEFAASRTEGVDALGAVLKLVFSNTLTEPLERENTRLIRGDAVEAVRELKKPASADVDARQPLAVALPVVSGLTGDVPIFARVADYDLELPDSVLLGGSIQEITYRPTFRRTSPEQARTGARA